MTMRSTRLVLPSLMGCLLLLLVLLSSSSSLVAVRGETVDGTNTAEPVSGEQQETTQECEVGVDGECIPAENAAVNKTQELCMDSNEECQSWASQMECKNNPKFMLENCRKSCGTCG